MAVAPSRNDVADKAVAIGVPPEQIARGYHHVADVKLVDGERTVTYRTLINRGGTAVERWRRDGKVNDEQWRVIEHCQKLWRMAGTERGLVSDHNRIAGTGSTGEGYAQQDALDELTTYRAWFPLKYWDVFENVVRWDEPAGSAGSSLASNKRSAMDSAHLCICFVADFITMKRRH